MARGDRDAHPHAVEKTETEEPILLRGVLATVHVPSLRCRASYVDTQPSRAGDTMMLALVLLLQVTPAHYRYAGPAVLPDSLVTPGAVQSRDTAIVCHRLTGTVRHTTQATKNAVYRAYGIRHHTTGQYEVDHLIPLELGGADTITNLWPEPAKPVPGFHQKDLVENWLHRLACQGIIPLDSAQHWIAHDWYSAYRIFKP